jgi:hypothetical protein
MLVENTQPCARSIGSIILIPGFNQIDDARWDGLMSSSFGGPVKGLLKDGILNSQDAREKLTIAVVEKTYEPNLLNEWLADSSHKGPLRGALRKQLQAVEVEDSL